jgi:hypothetical protein
MALPRAVKDGSTVRSLVPIPRKIGLVIGIDSYQNRYWKKLDFARQDAKRFGRMLKSGGFAQVIELTTNKQTTLRAIRRGIQQLKLLNLSPQDTVVIYISAHGTLLGGPARARGKRYIIAFDSDDEQIAKTGLSVSWLIAQMKGFVSQRKALILATCHSQQHGSKSQAPRGQKGALSASLMPRSTTMLVLNAASYGYAAYESKELKGDVYTFFFLACVKMLAKRRGRGARVSAIEAHACSVKKTYRYVYRHRRTHQLPGLVSDVRGLNSIYLIGRDVQGHSLRSSPTSTASHALLSKGLGRSIIQVPSLVLEKYRIDIYHKKRGRFVLVKRLLYRGEMVAVLRPGLYRFAFVRRTGGATHQMHIRLRIAQRKMLSPPHSIKHLFALSVGVSQVGASPFRTTHPTFSIGYRRQFRDSVFWGFGLGYLLGQKPEGYVQFGYHRLTLCRLEFGWSILRNRLFSFSIGLFARFGFDISLHQQTRQSVVTPAGGGGGLADVCIWLSDWVGLRLGGDIGVDLALVGAQAVLYPSLSWRLKGAFLFRL